MKYFLDLDFQDNKLTVLEAYVNFLKKTRKRHLKSNCETIIFEKDQYKVVFLFLFLIKQGIEINQLILNIYLKNILFKKSKILLIQKIPHTNVFLQ